MNVARLNFSHGTHEDHAKVLTLVREESEKVGLPVAVFQDLCGPKVRIGELEGGTAQLIEGGTVALRRADGSKGSTDILYVEAFDPISVIKIGEKVLLADGHIELQAQKIAAGSVYCTVKSGGNLRSRSGLAVPDSKLNLPCLTEKDLIDLAWAVKNDIDFVALSFVSSPKDVILLREKIEGLGGSLPIIAKIELRRLRR
jgi:pyruvate kinase